MGQGFDKLSPNGEWWREALLHLPFALSLSKGRLPPRKGFDRLSPNGWGWAWPDQLAAPHDGASTGSEAGK